MSIAVIGSNMVDLISYITRMPEEGETIEAPDFRLGCGGKGANQAIVAARLGSEVVMVTRVGDDLFAENTIRNFAENGIDTTHVLRTEGSSGVAPIFVDQQSHNSIIIVKGANNQLSADDIEAAADRIKECKLIVLQLEIPLETVYAAVAFGKEHGIPVLLNPAPAAPDLVLDRVKSCDFIVPNETELSLLTGMPVESEDDIRNAAAVLLNVGIKNVIVTLGSRGVYWTDGEREEFFAATKVQARDTTGAGDAFIGCFSHVWVKTGDIAKSLEAAGLYAGDSVTRLGTQTSYANAQEFKAKYPEVDL
ncbi:ribokinase [Gleimia sp. 6138-11-ORH1]|uniref:ribokinase n=1 Tax=Gleimia sp. 6138-11-ORH1 TaxID=2973937 RepID=UPI002167B777|nr:ribokinase [Gleimia sp. 6138-11-ORH1]MCS4483926.1 ribokinase [Gleimia sp. 6138-11-ORH1]